MEFMLLRGATQDVIARMIISPQTDPPISVQTDPGVSAQTDPGISLETDPPVSV